MSNQPYCAEYQGPWNWAGEYIYLSVTNKTANPLLVVGKGGSDLSIDCDSTIEANSTLEVAGFPVGNDTQDRYDWIYLKDLGTGNYYQIYIEVTSGVVALATRRAYAFFGYYTQKHDNSANSNACPFRPINPNAQFPSCYALVSYNGLTTQSPVGFEYILLATPPNPDFVQSQPGPCTN
jgi:hypothetical protein